MKGERWITLLAIKSYSVEFRPHLDTNKLSVCSPGPVLVPIFRLLSSFVGNLLCSLLLTAGVHSSSHHVRGWNGSLDHCMTHTHTPFSNSHTEGKYAASTRPRVQTYLYREPGVPTPSAPPTSLGRGGTNPTLKSTSWKRPRHLAALSIIYSPTRTYTCTHLAPPSPLAARGKRYHWCQAWSHRFSQ